MFYTFVAQVELLVTYEGSRFVVNDLKLLMDTFHRVEFTGTWRKLFSRVKKHIIWGVLKSVTGMQVRDYPFCYYTLYWSKLQIAVICFLVLFQLLLDF